MGKCSCKKNHNKKKRIKQLRKKQQVQPRMKEKTQESNQADSRQQNICKQNEFGLDLYTCFCM